jgi:hypothetical protein
MMHCHVCDEDVPLGDILNHVRLFHPDAYPISDHVEIHVSAQDSVVSDRALSQLIQRHIHRRPPGRTA